MVNIHIYIKKWLCRLNCCNSKARYLFILQKRAGRELSEMNRQVRKYAVEKVPVFFFPDTKCEPDIFVLLHINMSSSRATATS